MTIAEAKVILGIDSERLSDNEVQEIIDFLDVITEIAVCQVDNSMKK